MTKKLIILIFLLCLLLGSTFYFLTKNNYFEEDLKTLKVSFLEINTEQSAIEIKQKLENLNSIKSVEIDPKTGKGIIIYNQLRLEEKDILEYLKKEDLKAIKIETLTLKSYNIKIQ